MAPGPTCTPFSQVSGGTINWHSSAKPVHHTHSQPPPSSTSPKRRELILLPTSRSSVPGFSPEEPKSSYNKTQHGRTGSHSTAGRPVTRRVSCTSDTCSPAQLTCSFLLWALPKSQCNEEPLLPPHGYSGSFTASPWGCCQRHLISPHLPPHFIKGPVTHQDLRKNRPPPLPSSTISPLVFCFAPDH